MASPRASGNASTASPDGDRVQLHNLSDDVDLTSDDDIDFAPASESMGESQSPDGSSDMGHTEYYDAEHGLGPIEIEFELTDDSREVSGEPGEEDEDDEDDDEEDEDDDEEDEESGDEDQQTETEEQAQPIGRQTITLTQQQILRLLGQAGLRGLFATHTGGAHRRPGGIDVNEDDDDDDYLGYSAWGRSRRRPRTERPAYPKVPSEEGQKLMESGIFGLNERRQGTYNRKKKLAYRTMIRELALGSAGKQRSTNKIMSQTLIPNSAADSIINYNARCYSGQFSDDGNFFFSCAQDFRVRMYDTSNPYKWKYYKTAHYLGGQWTITDATLSPDNRFLAYSSITSTVCLSPTDPENNMDPTMLQFADVGGAANRRFHGGHFGIWSLRYSGDGREIVAGTSDESIYVYDIEAGQTTLRIKGHRDDVNAVCYGDKSSPHILYSGSDDTTIKVWDRRSMGDGREAGALMGHTEGLTYIDSKGDGRYVLSNAKDQTMKLWDLRKMMTTEKFDRLNPQDYTTGFDYRFSPYDEEEYEPHPHDCSVVTFRGHKVLKTLIRCHFSPAGSSDGRYVYSGSYDGAVYVWNLDGTLASKIDVLAATKNSRPVEDERYVDRYEISARGTQWQTIVRDASWHPNAPIIAATSWNGWDHGLGTCTVHSWNDGPGSSDECDDPEMGARLNAQLNHDMRYYANDPAAAARASARAARGGGGAGAAGGGARRARTRAAARQEEADEDE